MGLHYPRSIWVVPTTRCNTRCKTCGHFYNNFGEDMSSEVFAKIESEVLDHVRRVHLVGGGEPLISKIFPSMLEACIQRKIKIFFITNTIALTEDMVRVLVKNNAEIMVSIDGATAETYNSIRPFIRFDRLLNNLEMIKSIRTEYPGNQFKLITNTVVMKRNLHELPLFVKMASDFGVDSTVFSDLILIGIDTMSAEFAEEIPVKHPELIRKYAPKAIKLASQLNINCEMPSYYYDFISRKEQEIGTSFLNKCSQIPKPAYAPKGFIFPQKCSVPWTYANFLVNGEVSTCCITGRPLGNILEESFSEIWNGDRYNAVRRFIHTNNPPSACKNCNLIEGISAGNPSFFSMFMKNNHLQSLELGNPRIHFKRKAKTDGSKLWLEGLTEVEIQTENAEFLALNMDIASGELGKAVYGDMTVDFNVDDTTVLLPLPESIDGGTLHLRLELTGPVKLRNLELLSYHHKALDLKHINNTLIKGFHSNLLLINNHLVAALKRNPSLKTTVIFGANQVGAKIQQLAEEIGLFFLGFVDNYITYFDGSEVYDAKDLPNIRPDIVLISSKAHANIIAVQVKSLLKDSSVIISCRD